MVYRTYLLLGFLGGVMLFNAFFCFVLAVLSDTGLGLILVTLCQY